MRPGVARAVRLRALWPLPIGPAVAVLGWHRIDTEGGRLAVNPTLFARQMEILDVQRQQVPVVPIEQARAMLAQRFTAHCVALTFDDAWADNHVNALGPLSRHRLPATLYTPSRLLGAPGFMTRTQLLEMDAEGVAIGAHSRTHIDLRACSPAQLEHEIRGSKEDLENLIAKPVTSFAYPTGLVDDRVVRAVSAAGFTTAVTTRPGWWRPTTEALLIPRGFAENFSEATFRAAVRGGLGVLRPLDAIRRLLADFLPSRRAGQP
jgi:peptidoglycan/xylan/chitin deacetylase (PgdA/CDA1 family)